MTDFTSNDGSSAVAPVHVRPHRSRAPGRPLLSTGILTLVGLIACLAGAHAKPYGPGTSSAASHMAATAAMTCEARSPSHRVALVELFTSEGCSSCPPADRWLSKLTRAGLGFDKVVPLSLHVTYWDYIGWQDPYAQPQFTSRQRDYARQRGTTTVYTPQVVLAGQDFPGWSGGAFDREIAQLQMQPATARIELQGSAVGSALQLKVKTARLPAASAAAGSGQAEQLHLAVFEMGLQSKVTRGENRGETLTHDYVVRQWQGPIVLAAATSQYKEVLTLAAPAAGRSLGVAAFVQDGRGAVLQATACVLQ